MIEIFPKFVYSLENGHSQPHDSDDRLSAYFESFRNDKAFLVARTLIEAALRREGSHAWQRLFVTLKDYTKIEIAIAGPAAIMGVLLQPEEKIVYPSVAICVAEEPLKPELIKIFGPFVTKLVDEKTSLQTFEIVAKAPCPSLIVASQFPATRGKALRTAEWAYCAAVINIARERLNPTEK